MLHKFNPDLSIHEIYWQGNELSALLAHDKDEDWNRVYSLPNTEIQLVATLRNPILVTDNEKISQLWDYIARNTIQTLLQQSKLVTIEYDGVSMEFDKNKYPWVRSPSIDTLLITKRLRNKDLSQYTSLIEVWSGPWFIAKYLWEKTPSLQNITLTDINPNAKEYFEDNYTNKDRFSFQLWDAREYLENNTADIVVCNPPYIARPHSIDDNAYEWLSLIEYLLNNASKFLTANGKLFINISSLSDNIIEQHTHNELDIKITDTIDVPLKVMNVLNNREWMEYLSHNKLLIEKDDSDHPYRQTLKLYEISLK
jgi:methylase of polypeptide subunit release factors